MRLANIIVSIFLLLFSAIYAILIAALPARNLPNTLGAAFVPWVLVGFLGVLSLMLLLDALLSKNTEKSKVSVPIKEIVGIIGLLLLIVSYVRLMNYLGFIPDSIIFLALLTWIAGSRKPFGIAVFSITTTVIIYLLFHNLFNVQFPAGMFF